MNDADDSGATDTTPGADTTPGTGGPPGSSGAAGVRRQRIAGAPITWGVCEVPGWGHQLAPGRVLREMREVGLTATEFGPEGFLPTEPGAMADTLRRHDLSAVGGFTPLLLHVPGHDPLPHAEALLAGYEATGADVLVLSAVTGQDGYDSRPELDATGWQTLLANLDRITALAAERGVRAVLHPHVGTMVENGEEVRRVLADSTVSLCLDTGHLLVGGTDPAELTRQAPERVAHTHMKDVNASLAEKVRSGRLPYTEAVREGMYRPLGAGDVDVEAIVTHLTATGFEGWHVLEQDTVLTGEPGAHGPLDDAWTSAEYLRTLLARTGTGTSPGPGPASGPGTGARPGSGAA